MSPDEAGKWLTAVILEQPLFSVPVYQEKLQPPSSDGPLMVLTNVSKSQAHDVTKVDFRLHINPILIDEILNMFFDADDPASSQIGAHCIAKLDIVVSRSVEEVLYRLVYSSFDDKLLGKLFPLQHHGSFRNKKLIAMRAIYDRLTKNGAY